ncbi:MAG: MBL fold metallo-hydrolase [Lachnospiraceae bacterium]|nr:MBL fold metallo-hydrolase [Lachnospiraceae bacterium]
MNGRIYRDYLFREITKEEIPQMFELILKRMIWMDEKGIKQWNVTKYDEVYPLHYYEDAWNRGEIFVLVDKIAGEIVCAGALKESDERWKKDNIPAFYLHHFVTKVGEQGIGRVFLQYAEKYAKEKGKIFFRLDSAVGNDKLTKYYEEQGYLPVGSCVDGMYEGILRQKKLEENLMFQYVSNAGIVLEVGDKTIGIDCLCRDSAKLYMDTPTEIREKFNPDILIFTHEHEDHFCAEYVKEAWEKNQGILIYSTKETIEVLREMDIPSVNLRQVSGGDELVMGDLHVTFMHSVHEGEQYAHVQNLTLLIKIGDKRLVITGDAMPCKELFEQISVWSKQVDWLFAPFPYVGLLSTRKLIAEYLDVKNIFVLHLPRKEADAQGWIVNTKRVCEMAKDGLPKPVFPEKI